jgi:Spy/CpxP family protein refolding chaperone
MAVAVVIGALVAGALSAGPLAAHGLGVGRVRAFRAALAKLDLSAEQKDKVKAIWAAEAPTVKAVRAQLRAHMGGVRSALNANPPDPTAIGNAMLLVKTDRDAMRAEAQKVRDAIVALLTPEQKAKLDGYLAAVRTLRQARGPDA